MISLIKVLDRGQDGYNLGHNFIFNAYRLRMPTRRSEDTKSIPCKSRNSCRRSGGQFYDGLCQPSSNSHGFPGVYPYSGQKTKKTQNHRKPRGSLHNSIRRGRYADSPTQNIWRRPGRMRKI